MKSFFQKWGHGLLILYGFFYMPCFSYLERVINDSSDFHVIHCAFDDLVPFCEYFIIPYYFWFAFVGIACVYFFFRSQGECVRMGLFLITGITIAVIIYAAYPNGLADPRPKVFPRDNFCTDLVKFLYSTDTSTNVLPSLHVYNTLVVVIAVFESRTFGKFHNPLKIIVSVIGILIILSTMFLKQHSVYDVILSFIMAAALYPLFYKTKWLYNFNSDLQRENT
ncbi:MAG: phosphatase PAP2 family protein [Butyrivibrio sp.]